MKITEVRVRKTPNKNKLKGVASVIFDNVFVVHDIKIILGDKGMFVGMPSRCSVNPDTGENEFRDIAHPINSNMRKTIESAVLDEYNKEESDD